jgi:hypothetical protein
MHLVKCACHVHGFRTTKKSILETGCQIISTTDIDVAN